MLRPNRIQRVLVGSRKGALRGFAYRLPLVAPLPKVTVSQPKLEKPPKISQVLGKPSRRTRSALVIILALMAFSFTSLGEKEASKPDEPFNPQSFSSFTLTSREFVSSTSSIFTLKPEKPPNSGDPYSDLWKKGLWSLELKQPQLQIARSYTPLPPFLGRGIEADHTASELKFLIRHDGQGEVSNYLYARPTGSSLELRGPRIEYQVSEHIDEIVFLAGGTGIGPALQTLQTLLSRRSEEEPQIPRMKILWANRRREDCVGGAKTSKPRDWLSVPQRFVFSLWSTFNEKDHAASEAIPTQARNPIVHALSKLQAENPEQLSVEYFVDEENTHINPKIIKRFTENPKLTQRNALGELPNQGKRLILISGPDGFVEHFAGPKGWRLSVQVQGDLGGVLGKMKLDGWEVRKL